ncbi:MAG TPA: PQQ-dependent sugar dehydrogenase [Steroidobacteraceae bacterium]|jgi:glucose/arabinose dehydrogenase/cytochrome c2|nr:PQQ-dependent sugar dehydrogenase [Steroidobacteraceae bacterium]
MRSIITAAWLAGLVCAAPVFGADANAGKAVFRAQCALCHSAEPGDNGGAQGPNLNGVFGRHSASTGFGYTAALKASGLTWDAATLDRFLTSPTTVVPGSAMVVPVPDTTQRANLIAYFQGVKDGTFKPATPALAGGPPSGPPPGSPGAGKPIKGFDDWRQDVPGRVHRIRIAKLPAAYDTPSSAKFPRLVPRPADANVKLPPGFQMTVFATGTTGARKMLLAPDGNIFLSETQANKIVVMHPSADGSRAEQVTTYAQGLVLPHGMAFYPNARHPKWLYVAETNRLVRYAYKPGDTVASGVPEIVVAQLSPVAGGGHFSRDVAFSLDGKKMYVSVGSQSNVAEDMPKKSPDELKAWEAAHGLGAAWGNEENRADVLVWDVGATDKPGKVFASGIRNCVSLTIQPGNGALWCTTNERDMLGDDLVPDYSTRVKQGAWYGWPWYYMGNHEDPRHAGERPDLAGKVTSPDVPFQAHSAALNLTFYTHSEGTSAFPKEYQGDGFAVFHGSWNRAFRTGHKVVRVRMKNGVPTGEYDDFLVGFIVDDGDAWGRPVALLQNRDGSLLLTDDIANMVYRIAYKP